MRLIPTRRGMGQWQNPDTQRRAVIEVAVWGGRVYVTSQASMLPSLLILGAGKSSSHAPNVRELGSLLAADDEHSPERPVLLAVDQQLDKSAGLRVAPELADLVGPLEVGEHQDVEQIGAGSRPERSLAQPDLTIRFSLRADMKKRTPDGDRRQSVITPMVG